MKPLFFLSSLLIPGAVSLLAAPIVVRDFKASRPVVFPLPAAADSASADGNLFKLQSLLDAPSSPLRAQLQDWTTVNADSSGKISLVKAQTYPSMQSFAAKIRASRFAKGKLLLKASPMAKVIFDGNSVIKLSKADSVPAEKDAEISLAPEKEYLIQVTTLSLPDDKGNPVFSLEFVPDKEFEDVAISVGSAGKRHFTLEDAYLGKRVSGVSMSPDGKYMVVKFSERLDKKNVKSDAVLLATESLDTVSAYIPSGARWMPSGSKLFYTESRDKVYDLYTLDVPSMKRSLLAAELPSRDIVWAPDCSWFLYGNEVKGKEEKGPLARYTEPDDRIVGNRDRLYLMKYDLKSRVAVPLTYGGATTSLLDISPDSKKILYCAVKTTPSSYPFYSSTVVEMDAATFAADTLFSKPGTLVDALYSPDGKELFVAAGPSFFGKIGENSGKHPITNEYDVQGYLYNIESGSVMALTRDFNPSLNNGFTWNEKNGLIYFTSEEGFYTPLYSLDPKSGKIAKIDTELPSVARFSIGGDEDRWLVYSAQGVDNTGTAYLLDLASGNSRLIADPLKERFDDVEFGKVDHWRFKSKRGDMIDGLICLPPEFDPSKKYPLIVYYYGGTSPSTSGITSPYSHQVFASRDYVVYVVNPSGTTGYGQEFSARHVNAWGDYTSDDIIEGTKQFCKEHPFVDSSKIGCIGASYGGFMTQYLLTKTNMFAAGVSHAGISNVTSYWGEGYWGYSYNAVAAAKSYPWSNPKLFTEHGSLFNADKIKTPLLLLHGTVDTNVPIGESIQLFNALKILGRDVEFITVDGENHVISDYEKRQLWQNTIMAWFAKWLQDDPRWWDSLYGN